MIRERDGLASTTSLRRLFLLTATSPPWFRWLTCVATLLGDSSRTTRLICSTASIHDSIGSAKAWWASAISQLPVVAAECAATILDAGGGLACQLGPLIPHECGGGPCVTVGRNLHGAIPHACGGGLTSGSKLP